MSDILSKINELKIPDSIPKIGTNDANNLASDLIDQASILEKDFYLPNFNTINLLENDYIKKFNTYIKSNSPLGLLGNTAYKLTALKSTITSATPRYSDIICTSGTNIVPPESINYVRYLQPVRDQGPYGTCVAFSSGAILEFQLNVNKNSKFYVSPAFIYLNKSSIADEGMTLEEGLSIISTYGAPTEVQYPYNNIAQSGSNPIVYTNKSSISSVTYKDAKPNILINSFACIQSIQELKSALANNGPCLIGLPVFLDKNGYTPDTFWKKADGSVTPIGGHCVCVVGYDKNKGFLLRNSWGTKYVNGGYNWFPYTDWGIQLDCWTAVPINKLPDDILINNDVSPSNSPSEANSSNNQDLSYLYFLLLLLIPLLIGVYFVWKDNRLRRKRSIFETESE